MIGFCCDGTKPGRIQSSLLSEGQHESATVSRSEQLSLRLLLPSSPLSERRRYCVARRPSVMLSRCVCVCPPSRNCTRVVLVSAAKVMRCIQCCLVCLCDGMNSALQIFKLESHPSGFKAETGREGFSLYGMYSCETARLILQCTIVHARSVYVTVYCWLFSVRTCYQVAASLSFSFILTSVSRCHFVIFILHFHHL